MVNRGYDRMEVDEARHTDVDVAKIQLRLDFPGHTRRTISKSAEIQVLLGILDLPAQSIFSRLFLEMPIARFHWGSASRLGRI